MIRIDNINYLRENHREIRELLISLEGTIGSEPIEIIETKNGLATLQVLIDGRPHLIHSKYDPIKEAERYVEQFAEEAQQYQHVLFYGIGLGYHIEAFLTRYPQISFTLYEPNSSIFYKYVSYKDLKDIPLSRLKGIHIEKDEDEMKQFLHQFSHDINEKVLLVSLPSYEQVFAKQYQAFLRTFKEIIIEKRTGFQTNLAFEHRWTINSMMNFPTTIKTPNILHDIDKRKFKGKPVLLVAAGPSLAEEIENIRHIKEKGLAYIFSVGSAINALIEYGVYPDAACTYDPTQINQIVFQKLVEKEIDSIPLIYGTSVGFETLQNYPGPKIHMVTSQDTVTPYYFDCEKNKELEIVNDAPSIAVVTLQLLYKLGCNPIILVGQNLAYKDNIRYSKGIKYKHISSYLEENEINSALKTESVYGDEIITNHSFNRMRKQIETYLRSFKQVEVYNTTQGGAKIEGTSFVSLRRLIEDKLNAKIVDEKWYHTVDKILPKRNLKALQHSMESYVNEFELIMGNLVKILIQIENNLNNKQSMGLERQFNRFDKEFKIYTDNIFYKVYIAPMVRVQYEMSAKGIQGTRFEKDIFKKAKNVVSIFSKFIFDCKNVFEMIYPLYDRINIEINRLTDEVPRD